MVNSRGTRSLLRLTTKTTLRSRPLFFTLFALNVISTGIDRPSKVTFLGAAVAHASWFTAFL